jgi:hypothetical protein
MHLCAFLIENKFRLERLITGNILTLFIIHITQVYIHLEFDISTNAIQSPKAEELDGPAISALRCAIAEVKQR